jgi:hypothetical protein
MAEVTAEINLEGHTADVICKVERGTTCIVCNSDTDV